MKVNQHTVQPVSFEPIQLNITIETKDEYEALRSMFWYNAAVPDIVFPENVEKHRHLAKLMAQVLATF